MTPTALNFHLLSPEDQAAFRAANPPKERKSARPVRVKKKSKLAKLDCIHLDVVVFSNGGKSYRECLAGFGDICGCDNPQKCGPGCVAYARNPKAAKV